MNTLDAHLPTGTALFLRLFGVSNDDLVRLEHWLVETRSTIRRWAASPEGERFRLRVAQLVALAQWADEVDFAGRTKGVEAFLEGLPYGVALHALSLPEIADPFWLAFDDRPDEARSAFNAIASDAEFEENIVRVLGDLGRPERVTAVREGMVNLREGRFYAAAATLIAQTEGVIDDWLVQHGLAFRDSKQKMRRSNGNGELLSAAKKAEYALSFLQENRAMHRFHRDAGEHNPTRHGTLPDDPESAASIAAFQLLGVAHALSGAAPVRGADP